MRVKDKEGKAIFGNESHGNRWVEHFGELLNRPPPCNSPEILPARNNLPICCDAPTRRNIHVVNSVNKLNSGKAAEPDEIPPEAIKADVSTNADLLHPFSGAIWNNSEFPNYWKEGHLVKIPKTETSPKVKITEGLLYHLFLEKFLKELYLTG